MGRKLMRVPLDFDWELGKVWEHIGRIKTHDIRACVKNPVMQSGIDRANLITSGRSHFVYTLTHFWG